MLVNRRNTQEAVLAWLEMEKDWAMYLDDGHSRTSATGYRRRRSDGSLVAMIDMHCGPVTDVIHDEGCEPLERLATLSFIGPLDYVESMDDGDNVQNKDKVMNSVEDLVA